MDNTGIGEMIKKRPNLAAILLCAAGVILNLILSNLIDLFHLPLYFDTAGTVAVAIVGGYLPGIAVGFATNVLKAVTDPPSLYYGGLNVLIALVTTIMAKRGWHKKISGILGMIVAFSVIGGGFGAIISMFMEGLIFDSDSLTGMIYDTGIFSPEASHILSGVILNLPDKAISVLLALSIIHYIPDELYPYFSFDARVMDTNAFDESLKNEKTNVRSVSLRIKALMVLLVSISVVAIVCSVLGVRVYSKMSINEHSQLAQGTSNLAALFIDGDSVKDYLREDGQSQEYIRTKKRLKNILDSSPEISYLYIYKVEEDGFRVVFDIETEGTTEDEKGTLLPFDEGFLPYVPQLLNGEKPEPFFSNDKYGYLLTAVTPVYDSFGKVVCYAFADVDMKKLKANGQSFLMEMSSVFLGFFILFCAFSIWMVDNTLITPINSIVKSMDRLSVSSDTQESMDEDVKMFRRLGIHTGDELENLYLAASSMTKNQAENMRSIRRLSDSTAKMQDGLIITMADLVESRDSDTGDHVQKTASYVKIIVEGLRKKGYYAGKITPKFMSDVVRSAPLHDIGKIDIPDEVLNKPGKLTPEEFEIMKTHTTAGKRIIENAISKVEGDNYLKEARNMAAYHHERWDGKGYPEGIHGEVIPLSARIMAVADVFDALTSPRVYKEAFSLEKSISLLEEGKGTQFDPKCVEVFLDALPEVKVVLRKYSKEM